MRLLRQKCSKLQRAANKVTALTTLLLVHSVNVVTNKLTCCAGTAPCTVPEHVAESVIRVQSSANSASATATHIFPRFSPQKPKKALQTPSRIKVVPGKLSGLWTWIKDPTGFDAASDRLKAQHRAGKVSRAKVLKQCLNDPESPRIAAVHQDGFSGPVDMSMVQLLCSVQQGGQGSANGIFMQGSAVLADVHTRLREIDLWLAAQLEWTLSCGVQADMCSHSAPPDGYIEPVYDDHAVLERWRSHHEMHTCPDESDPNMMIAPLAAEKLAHRALDSATEGMIADVIQATDAFTLIA